MRTCLCRCIREYPVSSRACGMARQSPNGTSVSAADVARQMGEDGGLSHITRRLRSSDPSVRGSHACPLDTDMQT